MDKAWLVAQYAEIKALSIEAKGMEALNQHRLQRGETIAYDENAFFEKAAEIRDIANMIMRNR